MAATMTRSSELTYFSFPIEKTETNADGDLVVYGKASDGSVDSDEQIVDPAWMGKAVQDWLATGANVRVQHNAQRDPAGIGVEANSDSDGTTWVKSLIFEPGAMNLVSKGALRAYSVGIARPKIVRDNVARGGRIVDGELVEISLVDRPANKNCGIQLVKSAGDDGHAEISGEVFGTGEFSIKGAASMTDAQMDDLIRRLEAAVEPKIDKGADTVDLTLPKNVSVSFSPADLAKLLEHRAVAEKRQMDPNVGGGTDRDKIPASDFAGRNRSFPIVTPGDVSDAASSIGRAGADNYSSDKLKSNIISIARRKGEAFVNALPESWKGGVAADAEKGKGKPAFLTNDDDNGDGDDADKAPKTTKGMKDCGNCGKSYDSDAKVRRCAGCKAKLPKANKGKKPAEAIVAPEVEKTIDAAITKGDDFSCLGCGKNLHSDDKFCSECGKANTHAEKSASPGDGVTGVTTVPVPAHREPDGAAIEALEADAGMATTPDSSVKSDVPDEMATVMRLKSLSVSTELGFAHDVLCSAYHPDAVKSCYPDRGLADLDESYWMAKAMDASANAPLEAATEATKLWQHAVTIKGTGDEIMSELRWEAHKAFGDANPGMGSFPTPSELSATRFRRPLITAGHAAASSGHAGPNTAAVPASAITAAQFGRDALTPGHAMDSPGNKSMSATSYTSSLRNSARMAMQSMHDHIAQTFPDLCPMSGPGLMGEAPVGARPVPQAVGQKTVEITDDGKKSKAAKKLAKLQKSINEARAELGLNQLDVLPAEMIPAKVTKSAEPTVATVDLTSVTAPGVDTAVITDLIAKMQDTFTAQMATITKSLAEERTRSEKLQADIDALGDLPDPATAPFKGVAQAAYKTASPVAMQGAAETAERAQHAAWIAQLNHEWRTSPHPEAREAAERKLRQLNNLL